MKNFVSKRDILQLLGDNCDKIENTLNEISNELYTGKMHSREELLSLNCSISSIMEIITDVAGVIDFVLNREKHVFKSLKVGLKVALAANVVLFILGNPILALVLGYLQYKLYEIVVEDYNEAVDYLAAIADKGNNLVNRADNYQETINVKIKKKFEIKDELDADEELNIKFDTALAITDYLLRGYEIADHDEVLEKIIMQILIQGGAEGKTLDELVNDMRGKIASLEGGKTLKKED